MAAEKEITFETEVSAGAVKIADDVLLAIASQALAEVKGVRPAVTAAEGIVDKLVKKPAMRGIRVYLNDDEKQAELDVHIHIDYGVNIPEVSWAVQEAVKKNVESMTDVSVQKVNVFVDGVTVAKEPKPEKTKRAKKDSVAEDTLTERADEI